MIFTDSSKSGLLAYNHTSSYNLYVIYSHVAVFLFLHIYTWEYSTNGDYICSHKSLGVTTRELGDGQLIFVRVRRKTPPETGSCGFGEFL